MTTPHTPRTADIVGHACGATLDRRAFLQRAALAATAVVAALGGALPLHAAVTEIAPLDAPPNTMLRRYGIPATDGAAVDVDNELLIVRWNGRVHAFALTCPHRGARLQWRGAGEGVYCLKHKARYDAGGTHTGGRRTRDLDRHPVTLESGALIVDVGTRLRADADASAWTRAQVVVGG